MFLIPLAYIRDRTFASPNYIELREVFATPILALSLLPFGAIAGTYLMNNYGINFLLMILLTIISLIPIVIAYTKWIPRKYYPYVVFSVALTLLYHTSLISMYIWGWDIQYECYLTSNVIQNGFWDPTIQSTCNAMLSLVMLVPLYSITLNLAVDWVFKIIYPFLFTFVPLGLYATFRQQTHESIALFGCFFLIFTFVYYNEMLSLARQEVAELFVVLIILSTIDSNLSRKQKIFLFFAFSTSLIVSHYGLAYLFMYILFLTSILVALGLSLNIQNNIDHYFRWMQGKLYILSGLNLNKIKSPGYRIPLHAILFYGLFILIWYIYTSSSSSFEILLKIVHQVSTNMPSGILNPDTSQGLAVIITNTTAPLHEVGKYLHVLAILFITIGFVTSWLRHKWIYFDLQFHLLALSAFSICFGALILPYFSSAIGVSRIYHVSLIFLSLFCVIGGMTIFSKFKRIREKPTHPLKLFSIFLAIFLLFNCGWIYEVGHENTTNFAINSTVDSTSYNLLEIQGVKWLLNVKEANILYADLYRQLHIHRISGQNTTYNYPIDSNSMDLPSYSYFGEYNKLSLELITYDRWQVLNSYTYYPVTSYVSRSNRIYDNGGPMVYYNDLPPQLSH
ncbi:DUF2206 domain-containing protein [Methanoculleus frigidifontis]|nr:DUF2206 domain-containing protein [Methanoculleus sp. FWC-SCC1]